MLRDYNEECIGKSNCKKLCDEFGFVNLFDHKYPNHDNFKTYHEFRQKIEQLSFSMTSGSASMPLDHTEAEEWDDEDWGEYEANYLGKKGGKGKGKGGKGGKGGDRPPRRPPTCWKCGREGHRQEACTEAKDKDGVILKKSGDENKHRPERAPGTLRN